MSYSMLYTIYRAGLIYLRNFFKLIRETQWLSMVITCKERQGERGHSIRGFSRLLYGGCMEGVLGLSSFSLPGPASEAASEAAPQTFIKPTPCP